MPLTKLMLKPGLYREGTIYSNSGGWYDGDKIRFRSGLPEKIGGWTQVDKNTFTGVGRSIWVWSNATTGINNNYIGLGTSTNYYIYFGGNYNDITPIYRTDTSVTLTTNGTTTVTLTDVSYNPSVNNYINFSTPYTVGGYVFLGNYQITSVPTSTTYTIIASSAPTAASATVTVNYLYPGGANIFTTGTGWGAGPWGGYYGPSNINNTGWGQSASSTAIGSQLRLWSNDNFGADLIISPRGGPIYYWQNANGLGVRAKSLQSLANSATLLTDATTFAASSTSITITSANAPYVYPYSYISGTGIPANTYVVSINNVTGAAVISNPTTVGSSGSYTYTYSGAFIPNLTYQILASDVQEFIIAFGSNSYIPGTPSSSFNPLLVRWSDQANPYQWVPQITNQSGEFALGNGSYIVGARSTRQEILVWTDSALYSMQYIGAPYVWGFQMLMDNISIISPNAMITVNNVTYWMGRDRFYMYNGTVQTLPCTIKQFIFEDINQSQGYQVFSGANEGFNEIWWFYVSIDGNNGSKTNPNTLVDRYAIYNYLDNVWYYGSMARTAWLQTGITQFPIAADYNGRLLYHENGNDDVSTGTPQAIDAYIQSSDIEVNPQDSGQHFGFVWRMFPDINFNNSTSNNPTVNIQLIPRNSSGSAYGTAANPAVVSLQDYSNVPAYTVQQFTNEVFTRLRGRQMAFRVESTDKGVAWQLGTPRFDIRPDGRR